MPEKNDFAEEEYKMVKKTLFAIICPALLLITVPDLHAQPGAFRGRGGTRSRNRGFSNQENSLRNASIKVIPVAETEPANGTYPDSADDICIWIHPADPNLSLVIGQSKDDDHGGVHVYDLSGKELQFLEDGKMNSPDLRYNFPLNGELVDIVVVNNRSNDSIAVYRINSSERKLETIGRIDTGHRRIYGLCMYHNIVTDKFYALTNFFDGTVQQWLLYEDNNHRIKGTKLREFDVGGQVEGCVADDEYARFYIGEENVGVWQYGAEPTDGTTRRAVDTVDSGRLRASVEGLTIYYAGGGEGYLIVSSQGSSRFAIYNRQGNNEYIESFEIVDNDLLGVDGCSQTDGIDVTNVGLGSAFPNGLFVAHDHDNTGNDNRNSNFKYIPWDSIANSINPPLIIDKSWNPRTAHRISRIGIDSDHPLR